ncbi:MAG: glycosyltransferase, partial [Verrucomicrobiota bacterium]
MTKPEGLYIVHLSIHGLIRGRDLELGRDADTGGQCKYVLELVKTLALHPRVNQVDLFTRLVVDPRVSPDYAKPVESLGHGAFLKRIAAGPRRYLRKESLWRYLDGYIDQCLAQFREAGRLPDIIHAHYADAGYVGSRLANLLGCPFIFTGHSLGRTKRARLLEGKADSQRIEKRYNLSARIEAEEIALGAAALVCTSTQQEVEEQYALYDFSSPDRMHVIPPGVDVSRFSTPDKSGVSEGVQTTIERFLHDPEKPVILAIARADEKKNLKSLVRAYGQSPALRSQANLVLVAGNRDTIQGLNPGARRVWTELLQLIDDFNLYGHVAIPKHHQPDDIPEYYRHAAMRRGLFVNPALTEPFGLTLIEAAASGLPILATNDGGPQDIIANCQNGLLFDPTNVDELSRKLASALASPDQWDTWSRNGVLGVGKHYTWEGHVDRYLMESAELLDRITQPQLITRKERTALPLAGRMIFTGLEEDLVPGDSDAI